MPVSALVATAGSASANAYVTRAVADQYHLDRPAAGTTWSAATSDQKDSAILWATRLMDALWEWEGVVVTETQALLFPRSGLCYRSGYTVPSTIIPTDLQHATAEFARQLLAADRAADSDVEVQGITSLRAGPVALTFKEGVYARPVPDAVVALIPAEWGYVRRARRGVRQLVRA